MELPAELTPGMRAAYDVLMADTESPIATHENGRWALLVDESDPVEWANRLLSLSRDLRGY